MAFTFKLEGLTETLAKFDSLPEEVQQEIDNELAITAEEMRDIAQRLAPVDVAKLKESIEVTVRQPLFYQVSALAKYSAYMEFGTGTKVTISPLPPDLAAYAIQFKGQGKQGKHPVKIKGKWAMVPYQLNLRAQPFFFPAYNAATKDLVKRLKDIIEDTAKKK
jgi:HK97 gp10 family phage protein